MAIESVLLSLGVLLFFAKIFGSFASRFGIAPLVGELVGGIVAGPVLGLAVVGDFVEEFMTLSVIFLLFMAGLEIKFDDIKHYTYTASILAFFGGILSFFLGTIVGLVFFNDLMVGFAIGVVLVTTSNGTLFLFLIQENEFATKNGKMIVAISIADDIVGILLLSFFSAYVQTHLVAFGTMLFVFFVSIGFYLIMFTAGSKIINSILSSFSSFRDDNILFTVAISAAIVLAYVTENIGLSMAAGAFIAGMIIANSHYSHSVISPKVKSIANGFFVPVFYAGVGTLFILEGIDPLLILAILAAAIIGKVVGIGFISKFFGFRRDLRKLVGIAMITRGSENIAVIQIIFLMGVISYHIYTSLVFVVILTILLTPVLLRLFYKK